jgi:hypothetical protein
VRCELQIKRAIRGPGNHDDVDPMALGKVVGRTEDGIVIKRRNDNPIARTHNAADGRIQRMGRIEHEGHPPGVTGDAENAGHQSPCPKRQTP